MFQLKTILNEYWTMIKYILLIVFFIIMIVAINQYEKYLSVNESIVTVNNRTAYIQNEMDYAQNFQAKYLDSDYWYLFLAHDNSMIFDWEEIVLFKPTVVEEITWFSTDLTHIPLRLTEEEEKKSMDPKDAWKLYLQEKWSQIN